MSRFPSLPLFTDAFIADTGHLSAQETGAYLMLLMMAWRQPECRLPDDDEKLARWARLDRRAWLRIKPTVMEFWTLEGGFWAQRRLSKERDVVSKRAEVARENGQHGGRPKPLKTNDAANPAGSLRATQEKAPNPNPNPIEDRAPVSPTEIYPERPEDDIGVPAAPEPRKPSQAYAFESGVIRLTERDFAKWKAAFAFLSLPATLIGLSGYAQEQFEKTGNWFWPVQRACAKRNEEARLAVERIKVEALASANAPRRQPSGYCP